MPFQKMFRHAEKQAVGFTQSEREAVVDILHYCMYADRHIARAEDQMIETVARTLNWDPSISYEYYEGKSTGAVRRALAEKELRADFMKSLRARLSKPEHRKFALSIADDLMKVDGVKPQEEFIALLELKKALET